jgi:hypothetical protein
MEHRRVSRLGFVWLAVVVALGAAPACAAAPAAVELVEIFARVCLEKFPDDTAVRQFAAEKQLAVMPDDRLHRLLGTDPGEGWIHNTARGQYLLTVEMPPYHTCAIRKGDSAAPDFLANFSEVLAAWAAKQPLASLKQQPVQTTPVGGLLSQVYEWDLDRGPGNQAETLLAIVTNVTGRVEVRLVRAINVP